MSEIIFDSHAHVDDMAFNDDREDVINHAFAGGVTRILNPGADIESSLRAIDVAEKHPGIYAAVGVHPHDAKDVPANYLDLLKDMTKSPKVVAIGEIGLDYHYDHSPRDVQKKVFVEQIALAKQLALPIIIHDRESHGDILDIIKQENAGVNGGVLHCFSGSAEFAMECIRLGFHISIAGPITFKNSKKTAEVVERIPLDRLLIETDCPYLAPEPYRGKRNEPLFVKYTAARIAEIRGVSVDEICRITCENAINLFNII